MRPEDHDTGRLSATKRDGRQLSLTGRRYGNRLANGSLATYGGTGVSGLTRGLATLPQGGSRGLRWSEIRMEDPEEDPLAVHCFCVCSGSVLLGDLLGVTW